MDQCRPFAYGQTRHADSQFYQYVSYWPENGVPVLNMVSIPKAGAVSVAKKAPKWQEAKVAPIDPVMRLNIRAAPFQDRDGMLRARN